MLGDLVYYLSADQTQLHRIGTGDSSFTSIPVFEPSTKRVLKALAVDHSQNIIHTIDGEGNLLAFSTSSGVPVFRNKVIPLDGSGTVRPSCLTVEGNIMAFTSHDVRGGSSMTANAQDMTSFRIHIASTDYKHQFSNRIDIDPHPSSSKSKIIQDCPNPVVSLAFSKCYLKNFLLAATRYHRLYLLAIGATAVTKVTSVVVSDGRSVSPQKASCRPW